MSYNVMESRTIPAPSTVLFRGTLVMAAAALAALTLFAPHLGAQQADRRVELRPVVGIFLPTGQQRDLLRNTVIVGAQAEYLFTPSLGVVGTFGWAPIKDQSVERNKLNIYQYDLGLEARLRNLSPAATITTRPYVALGAGARSYRESKRVDGKTESNFLGFGALGVDLAMPNGPFGVRLEARDNVTNFNGLRGEFSKRETRNDVQLTGGLTFAF